MIQKILKGMIPFLMCAPFIMMAEVSIQQWSTAENMDVFLVEQHDLPMVDIQLIFPAGSASDKEVYGLANLSAQLIGEGTDEYQAQDIARAFASTGAILGRSVERDRVIFSLRSLSEFEPLTRSFNLFSDLFVHTNIRLDDFARQKAAQLVEIQYNEALPAYMANKMLFQQLYGADPYAHPRLGGAETVQDINLSQVTAFYQKHYVAHRAVLVFVGDIHDIAARKFSTDFSHALHRAEKKEEVFSKLDMRREASTQKKVFNSTQTQIQKGLLVMAENDPDRAALSLFNEILGGSAQSKMMKVIRDQQGLAYGAYSHFTAYQRAGPFIMSVQTRNDEAKKVEQAMNDLLADLVNQGPSTQDFNAAKQRLLGQFPLLFSSNTDIINIVARMAFYDYPLDYLEQYQKQIEGVELEQMKKIVQSRISLDSIQTVVVGP